MRRRARETSVPLIPFDPGAAAPYYRQVYDGIRSAILSGRLRPGQRLPSSRALAAELGVSRLPVVSAFEQLTHEGYLEGRRGSGSYVRDAIPDELAVPEPAAAARRAPSRPARPHLPENERPLGAFRVSLPALEYFPQQVWARIVSRHARAMTPALMAYGDPAGHGPLREAIAEHLRAARAARCEADQVIVVSGSQLALQTCARALLGPGDAVAVEEPGYPGARDALRASGAALVPVPVDAEGLDVARLDALGPAARAAYVTPSHQYPLGHSMSAARRLELLEWAARRGAWVIEDDYDSEYRYASRPLGALQGLHSGSRVIYVGTFSKVLFPSLRVGYLVAPRELVPALVRVRETLDIFSPTLYQLALTDFIREGHFARHVRRTRAVYLRRRDALAGALAADLAGALEPINADAGLHLTALLRRGLDDVGVVEALARRGVSASALSACYAGAAPRGGLILGFGGADERQIRRGVRTLRDVLG